MEEESSQLSLFPFLLVLNTDKIPGSFSSHCDHEQEDEKQANTPNMADWGERACIPNGIIRQPDQYRACCLRLLVNKKSLWFRPLFLAAKSIHS